MNIEAREHVHTRGTQVEGVENSSQVNVERIIPLTGKRTDTVLQVIETLCGQCIIIRHSAWTHVGGYSKHAATQYCAIVTTDHRHSVGLTHPQAFRTGTIQCSNRWQCHKGQEQTQILVYAAEFIFEFDFKADVIGFAIPIVIHVETIQNIGIKLIIVGTSAWLFTRDDVHDQNDLVILPGLITAEHEKIGDVGCRIK